MGVLRHLRTIRPAAILKSPKSCCMIIVLTILIVTCLLGAACWLSRLETKQIDMIYAMYDELKELPDFDALLYKDGVLFAVDYDKDMRMPLSGLTNCMIAMSDRRIIKGVMKIDDDIFFTTQGFVDNYIGFVLSEDTLVDMNTLSSLQREIRYEYGRLFCFSFRSV
jgi:hypothetical protein